MASVAAVGGAGMELRQVVARIERLPYCSWHTKMRLIISTAWFFDAFNSLAIAYVLPSLIGMWKLTPPQIGSLIAVGFAGQLIGSLGAGWTAERWGRLNTMLVTLLIFTLGSFACAFAWSYDSMWWIRLAQGVGLGGEVPIMAAYVNEFAKAQNRGRFSLGIQCLFAIGLTGVAIAGVWVVPHLGWQWMFYIGTVPALIALPLRMTLPESPRWLASRGRFIEADQSLKLIEEIAAREKGALPPLPRDLPVVSEVKPRVLDIFKGIYRRRTFTVWGIWICTYIITYGLTAWAPSLFRTVYHLDVQTSLVYGFILSGIGLIGALSAIVLIDTLGRRRMYIMGLGCGCVPLLFFAFGGEHSAPGVLTLVCLSFMFISLLALSLATYTAEQYPTHLRALGGGVAGGWQRGASMVGPLMVGWILPHWGLNAVFVVFGLFALLGAIIAYFFAIETRGQVLERLSRPEMRLVTVAPPEVGYVFASVAAEFGRRGHDIVSLSDEAAFLAAPEALAGADLLYCMGTLPLSRALLRQGSRLRAIVTPFIGTDAFNVEAATELGIVIANGQVPENYLSMAEATVMLMLAALYNLRDKEEAFRRNLPRPQRQTARMLRGKTVGLVGFGRMARAIADRLLPWGARLQAYAPRLAAPFPPHVARVELDALLRGSDIVSIHATLNDETRGLIGAAQLALLKPDAILINTARGGIVDEAAVARWAHANPEARIAFNVFAAEPLPNESPLRHLPNAILTPHLVGHTRETAAAVPQAAIENIARALAGEPPLYVRNPLVLPAWRRRWSPP